MRSFLLVLLGIPESLTHRRAYIPDNGFRSLFIDCDRWLHCWTDPYIGWSCFSLFFACVPTKFVALLYRWCAWYSGIHFITSTKSYNQPFSWPIFSPVFAVNNSKLFPSLTHSHVTYMYTLMRFGRWPSWWQMELPWMAVRATFWPKHFTSTRWWIPLVSLFVCGLSSVFPNLMRLSTVPASYPCMYNCYKLVTSRLHPTNRLSIPLYVSHILSISRFVSSMHLISLMRNKIFAWEGSSSEAVLLIMRFSGRKCWYNTIP